MKLIQRIGYYLGGFSIGLIILAFFLNGKKVSCDYGPDARVLKNINSKVIKYSDATIADSTAIRHVLQKGDIDFSKSESRQKPCSIYVIEGDYNDKEVVLTVENCDSIATITKVKTK
ncbi:hypothetical protein [Hwangdonia lutea]|uniref:DUF4258 domain-containing protein n=1 Tax=Hwangdonia lutea TaxID=3075823 RepID=A0AA97ENK2_9FLAO|nr:hypothetical protein [Hwangdonia sp. SCSIO 19198]WOD43345.1 hypothetical protein RNZ46_15250 [Hwangdonia sp. SCSIO 19198]